MLTSLVIRGSLRDAAGAREELLEPAIREFADWTMERELRILDVEETVDLRACMLCSVSQDMSAGREQLTWRLREGTAACELKQRFFLAFPAPLTCSQLALLGIGRCQSVEPLINVT